MGRKEKPLDDAAGSPAGSLAAFAAGLREVRRNAGSPSYRSMADQTHFSLATLSRAAAGNALPSADVVAAFVTACGGDVGSWLAERERVRVLLKGDGRDAAATLPPDPGLVPAQLPPDIADFAGRRAPIDALIRLVGEDSAGTDSASADSAGGADSTGGAAGPVVISAVTGMGGIGKTTLAVHVGHQVLAGYPDGQVYVNLRGAGASPLPPAEVLAVLLRDLGEPDRAIPADEESRAARFRTLTSRRRMLILLDDAHDAAQVRPLLPGGSGCAVLVTSRRRLPGLASAVPLHLDVLERPEALKLFTTVVGAERVAAEPEAVEAVLSHCAGLPLAVRIAASRLASRPAWSIATLADRLGDEHRRLNELRAEDVAVRASFLMSYRALTQDGAVDGDDAVGAARMFRLLGLTTAPDISVAAAAALAGIPEPDAEDALETLVDVNLVQSASAGRYRFHELLRTLAREIADRDLSPEERTAAVTRLIHWYIHTTAAAADRLKPTRLRRGMDRVPDQDPDAAAEPPFADRESAWRWLLAERANLAVLIAQAEEKLPGPEAWVLAQQASYFYDQRGLWTDTYSTHQPGLRCARRLGDAAGQSLMLAGIAAALNRMGRFEESMEAAGESAAAAEKTDDLKLVAAMRINHAGALLDGGRTEDAVELFGTAVADIRAIGDPHQLATSLLNYGMMLATNLQRFQDADSCFREARTLAHGADSPLTEARAVYQLALSQGLQGDTHQELSLLAEAVAAFEHIGSHTEHAECLRRLADALVRADRHDEAREASDRLTALLAEIGDSAVA